MQARPSNGYGRRKSDKDLRARFDNSFPTGKTNTSRSTSLEKGGGMEIHSCDRLLYLVTCLVGQQVEVQVKDGSVFSGIFHATNSEEEFGLILKMPHLINDKSRGQNKILDSGSKSASKTLVIPSKELVQVIAKGIPVTRDGLTKELQNEKQQELMIDSIISQSRHVELGRELQPWVPDADDPGCPELENIFDGNSWNRGWDQFEANATLFGVKSTFNEELYTTKLERGPQTRDLEREAMRIAREIEGEDTDDLHLAEERGIQLTGSFEIDEETRFSSVNRGVDDSGYGEIEDILLDSRNDETFGDPSHSNVGTMNLSTRTTIHGAKDEQSSQTSTSKDLFHSSSEGKPRLLPAEQFLKSSSDEDASKEEKERQKLSNRSEASKTNDATPHDPSRVSSKSEEKVSSSNEQPGGSIPPRPQGGVAATGRPGSSASSTSDRGGAASTSAGRGLTPSSSMNSLSSEKSSLNPYAKEFKLNPNAKSFVPSAAPVRPASPVAAGSFYYPASMAAVPHMHGMPTGVGMGPPFSGQQPVMYNPQAAAVPQPYFHPGGPQYGQHMMTGQPHQVVYMPTYPPEMPYKGRDY